MDCFFFMPTKSYMAVSFVSLTAFQSFRILDFHIYLFLKLNNILGSVFKDGGKEEKKKNPTSSPVKCFFIRIHSDASVDQNASYILSNKSFSEVRWLFMHAHTVSSVSAYMARYVLASPLSFRWPYYYKFHQSFNVPL